MPESFDSMTGQCEGGCKAAWKQSKCDASTYMQLLIKCKVQFLSAGILVSNSLHIAVFFHIFTTLIQLRSLILRFWENGNLFYENLHL